MRGPGFMAASAAAAMMAIAGMERAERQRVIVIDGPDPELPSLRDRPRRSAPPEVIEREAPRRPRQSEADLQSLAAAADRRARKNARRAGK